MDKIRKGIRMKLGRKTEDKGGGEQACQRKRQQKRKKFVCPVCQMTFATKEEYEKHKVEKHNR